MAQVILFGGGDAGGIIITANGVRPIPPFDPGLRAQLSALSSLVVARASHQGRKDEREFGSLVNKIANLTIARVEDVVGDLEGDQALIYQSDDGGFVCGSTGKPPIPLPRPLGPLAAGQLFSSGVVDRDILDFVQSASEQKIPLREILANPQAVSQKLGRRLSERGLRDLQLLSPASAKKAADPVDREVIEFFNKVVDDGRHVARFASEPALVARDLGVRLSDGALDRIIAGGSVVRDPAVVANGGAVIVAVAVGILIMLVTREGVEGLQNVRDLSGRGKL